jgi:hypothetical protein
MCTSNVISLMILACAFSARPTLAQTTKIWPTLPTTKLEAFDTNIAAVILKASTDLGSMSADAGVVTIKCREVTDTSTGHKEQGIAVEMTQRGSLKDVVLIDYDEIPSLLRAIDYLNKLDVSTTSFNFVDAEYTTKGGLHIAAFGARRTGTIQFAVRDMRYEMAPITFSRQQLVQFLGLFNQAKSTLDSLHSQ